MSKIDLITRDGCYACIQAENLLKMHNMSYSQRVIGEDITRDEVLEQFPDRKYLPIVLIDDKVIGGYEELLDTMFPALEDADVQ